MSRTNVPVPRKVNVNYACCHEYMNVKMIQTVTGKLIEVLECHSGASPGPTPRALSCL